MKRSTVLLLVSTTAFVAAPMIASAAAAAATADSGTQLEAVVVTARKRSEDILKIPVSVSALTAKDITTRDIKTLDDISRYTPGLEDDQASGGGARTDRSFQQLIIRGMNPSSTLNPTTSVFINGAPVAAADFLQNLDDIERVEVLKGPQSAYFGRETFAGAVNVIATPAGDTFAGKISLEAGSSDTYRFAGSVNVPIIKDMLSVRVGAFHDAHDGSYRNAASPNQNLGAQQTEGYHVAVTAKPFENLTIKAFGLIFSDDDGPAATGLLLTNAGAFSQTNCTVANTPYLCGTLPQINSAVSPAQTTTITPALRTFFAHPGGVTQPNATITDFGLKRRAYHGDVNINYAIPSLGLNVTYLGGINRTDYSELSDLANVDSSPGGQYPGYGGFPFIVESAEHDFSHELRIATDSSHRYRALVGVSYVSEFYQSALGAPGGAAGIVPSGPTRSQTSGVFFSLAYDIIKQLTVTFDGRYQQDKETGYTAAGPVTAQGTSNDFLPRASVQFRPTADTMVYFTYSKGINPGTFNTQFNSLPVTSQTELNMLGVAGGLIVKPERIANYEVGFKGSFFDHRLTVSADAYYDKWTQQLNLNSYNFAAADPGNPYNVVGGAQYIPNNKSIYIYTFTDNSASTTPKGFEAEVNFIPVRHVTLNLAGALNDTRYNTFSCGVATCLPYPTTFNAAGKFLQNAPEYSFNAGLQYDHDINLFGTSSAFARVDYIYREGVYISPTNDTKTQDINLVNVRAGINTAGLTIEGYINNLTNNKSYVSGFPNYNFPGFFSKTAIEVGLPQLINGGVRIRYAF